MWINFKKQYYKYSASGTAELYIITMDTVILILAYRKGVDSFSVETHRLMKDPVFHGILHVLVTDKFLTFKRFFLRGRTYVSHMVIDQDYKEESPPPQSKYFKEMEGLDGHILSSFVLQKHYFFRELFFMLVLDGLFQLHHHAAMHLSINCFGLL